VKAEAKRSFACFGATVTFHVGGIADGRGPEEAAAEAEAWLLRASDRLSRFLPGSELSRLNRDPRPTVPASWLLLELAALVPKAGCLSDGLVDCTLLEEIEQAGYRESLAGVRSPEIADPGPALGTPASAKPARGWRRIAVDRDVGTVSRPPGLQIDSGGIAKGWLADLLAARLQAHRSYAVNCGGDIRIGGRAERPRAVLIEDPDGGEPLHRLRVADGAVATSGITRRRWRNAGGDLAHHLLDPRTGRPAFTGVVQATARAPSGFLAEVYAKYALLSGRESARQRLPFGGVLVFDDGMVETVEQEHLHETAMTA